LVGRPKRRPLAPFAGPGRGPPEGEGAGVGREKFDPIARPIMSDQPRGGRWQARVGANLRRCSAYFEAYFVDELLVILEQGQAPAELVLHTKGGALLRTGGHFGGAGTTGGATTGAPNAGTTTDSGVNSSATGQRPGGGAANETPLIIRIGIRRADPFPIPPAITLVGLFCVSPLPVPALSECLRSSFKRCRVPVGGRAVSSYPGAMVHIQG
jgi:hypothetical protein